jgi:P27 family predicted phage terminase small subunit
MPGRNPTPTAIKEEAGNPGHRPLNKKEPKPEAGEPAMPKGLSPAAKKKWKEIVPILLKMKVLTKADGDALANYCECYAMLQQARKEIRKGVTFKEYAVAKDGSLIVAKDGSLIVLGIKTNPAVTIADKMAKMMRAIGSDFGLSPVSRPKLHADNGDGESEDPMDAFLRRRNASQASTQ